MRKQLVNVPSKSVFRPEDDLLKKKNSVWQIYKKNSFKKFYSGGNSSTFPHSALNCNLMCWASVSRSSAIRYKSFRFLMYPTTFFFVTCYIRVCVCVCVCVERGAGAGTKLDHTSTIFLSTHFGVGYVLRGKITQQLSVRTSKIFQSGCSLQRLNISANKFRSTLCVCSPRALVGFF